MLLDLGIKSGCYVCFSWEDILILLCYRLILDGDMASYVHCGGGALMLVGHSLCVGLFCLVLQYMCITISLLHLHLILKHLLVLFWNFLFQHCIHDSFCIAYRVCQFSHWPSPILLCLAIVERIEVMYMTGIVFLALHSLVLRAFAVLYLHHPLHDFLSPNLKSN